MFFLRLTISRLYIIQCILIALVCLTQSVVAQKGGSRYKEADYLSQLSSKGVTLVIQDKKGYLWIGTDDGLNRYDGYSITVFRNNPDDSTSILENDIRALATDSLGNIWIGHSSGNISIFDQSSGYFHHMNAPSLGLANDDIVRIFFDKSGEVWICVARNGLFHYEKNRFVKIGDLPDIHPSYKKIPRDYRNYNTIYDIYDEGNGLFWLATHDGLYQYNLRTREFKSIREKKIVPFTLRSDLFNKILADENGFWMTSWGGGLTFFNPKTQEWKNYKPVNDPDSSNININILQGMVWKDKDQLWVSGTDFGLGYFDIKKEKFVFYNTRMCRYLFKDKTGMLWGTSEIDGLMKFDPVNLPAFNRVNVSRTDNGDYYVISSFYHDIKRHLLYYGSSFADGLHLYNEATGEERTYGFDVINSMDKALIVSSIYKDDRDTLWILTRDFIYWFDDQLKQLRKFKQPYNEKATKTQVTPDFHHMLRSHNGDLWITTSNNGVYRFDQRKQVFINYRASSHADSLNATATKEIVEDANERIWIRTEKGLSVYDYKSKKFKNYFDVVSKGSKRTHLHGLTKSPNGDIWIGSDDGVYQYNHLSDSIYFTHWTPKDGLPSLKIQNVQSDHQGKVWLITNSGLFFLDPVHKKVSPTYIMPTVHPYTLYIDDIGDIYMGDFSGYNHFSANALLPAIEPPSLGITSLKVNNNEFLHGSLPAKIHLNHDQNAITIEFSAFDFRNPSKTKYMFTLDGLESKWTTTVGQRLANYESLPPGDYTFKVKAASTEGVWTKPIEIPFKIVPPFWGTWYFKIGGSLSLLMLTVILYQRRIRKVRDEEKLTRRMLEVEMHSLRGQMNPHFIFNSLNSINKFILLADPETASFYLTKFSRLVRLILENSRQSKISLEQDLTALTHYIELELLRFDHRFSYLIDIDPCIDTTSTQVPPLIIQPFVENSIWHGFVKKGLHGKLTITIKKENDNLLFICIEDNGVGRNHKKNTLQSSERTSHGLKLTADRLKLLSQESDQMSLAEIIDLKNEKNEPTGTRVEIRLATAVTTKKIVQ